MKNLYLVLIAVWYDLIENGIKKEEYREITPYWMKRLFWIVDNGVRRQMSDIEAKNMCENLHYAINKHWIEPKDYEAVTFQRAYPKNPPRMVLSIEEITIGTGREEWGAKKGKEYFVIKLGERKDKSLNIEFK